MKKSFALLTAILLLAILPAGCKSNEVLDGCPPAVSAFEEPTAPPFEIPKATPSPTGTAAPTDTAEPAQAVVSAFIAAQDAGDWDSFVSLWTTEEQRYYRDFFAYEDNATKRNGYFAIQSAHTVSLYEVKECPELLSENRIFELPNDVWSEFNAYDALERYRDIQLWIAKTDYHLDSEFWDYREGVNYRVFVLVPEDGQWRVMEDYQGYPSAGVYFDDTIEEPEETEESYPEETPNTLVDGTVHYTDSATVYFDKVSEGDYVHADIITIDGTECSYWVSNGCTPILYSLSRYQKITIVWENRDVYIDEVERVMNLNIITEITILE